MLRRKRKNAVSHPPPTPMNVSLTLATLGVTSLLSGELERKRFWQMGALISAVLSVASAGLLAVAGNRRWTRIPVGLSFVVTIAAQRRLGLRVRRERTKRRWWHRFRPKMKPWRAITVRPAEVSWEPRSAASGMESA